MTEVPQGIEHSYRKPQNKIMEQLANKFKTSNNNYYDIIQNEHKWK